MSERLNPIFRMIEKVQLIGTMTIYDSQAEVAQRIPQQWLDLRAAYRRSAAVQFSTARLLAPAITRPIISAELNRKTRRGANVGREYLTLEAGEYAVVRVEDTALLGKT